jgi:hypothetical protein
MNCKICGATLRASKRSIGICSNHNEYQNEWRELRKTETIGPRPVCKICGKILDRRAKFEMCGHHPEARRARQKVYRSQSNHKESKRRSYERFQKFINQLKIESGCIDCGYKEHPVALDFDHKPGTVKCFPIGNGNSRSREKVLEEIAKCEVRCSNCHRIRTYERKQFGYPAQNTEENTNDHSVYPQALRDLYAAQMSP